MDSKRHRSRSPVRYSSKYDSRSQSSASSRGNSPLPRKKFFPERTNPTPCKCLGVFNLPLDVEERDIYDLFCKFGSLDDVVLVTDKYLRTSKGFAFVYFHEQDDADIAKEKLNNMEYHGRILRVDYSLTKRAHTPTPGVYLGRSTRRGGRSSYRGGRSPSPNYGRGPRGYASRYDDRNGGRDGYRDRHYDYADSYRQRSPPSHYRDRYESRRQYEPARRGYSPQYDRYGPPPRRRY